MSYNFEISDNSDDDSYSDSESYDFYYDGSNFQNIEMNNRKTTYCEETPNIQKQPTPQNYKFDNRQIEEKYTTRDAVMDLGGVIIDQIPVSLSVVTTINSPNSQYSDSIFPENPGIYYDSNNYEPGCCYNCCEVCLNCCFCRSCNCCETDTEIDCSCCCEKDDEDDECCLLILCNCLCQTLICFLGALGD